MYIEHHDLDPYPIPKEKSPLYINEPWLVDGSIIVDCQVKLTHFFI